MNITTMRFWRAHTSHTPSYHVWTLCDSKKKIRTIWKIDSNDREKSYFHKVRPKSEGILPNRLKIKSKWGTPKADLWLVAKSKKPKDGIANNRLRRYTTDEECTHYQNHKIVTGVDKKTKWAGNTTPKNLESRRRRQTCEFVTEF